MASVKALVKPEMLQWARKSAGLSLEEAARKAQTTPQRIEEWESGHSQPTIKQLRNLGRIYHRPSAVFYLPKPPKDFDALRDFRHLPGFSPGTMSADLRYEIRRAADRREIALELYDFLELESPEFTLQAKLSDDPDELAGKIRRFLNVDIKEQKRWEPHYGSLNAFKAKFENAGILVFQTSSIDPDEARGFSISGSRLPAVVVNSKESPSARIFTMFHELVHLALRISGICDLQEDEHLPPEERAIEVFCNRVAGAALVPQEELLHEDMVLHKSVGEKWEDSELKTLANRYGISREVILRRLLILEKTSTDLYQEKRRELLEEYQSQREISTQGFPSPSSKAVSQSGKLFVRLVLDNYYQNYITASDVSDFLGVKLKHLDKIEQQIKEPFHGLQH